MKNFILKLAFIIASILYIIATLTYATGITTVAIIINIVTGIFCTMFIVINHGKWIFK